VKDRYILLNSLVDLAGKKRRFDHLIIQPCELDCLCACATAIDKLPQAMPDLFFDREKRMRARVFVKMNVVRHELRRFGMKNKTSSFALALSYSDCRKPTFLTRTKQAEKKA
jgi:hypothetical protein